MMIPNLPRREWLTEGNGQFGSLPIKRKSLPCLPLERPRRDGLPRRSKSNDHLQSQGDSLHHRRCEAGQQRGHHQSEGKIQATGQGVALTRRSEDQRRERNRHLQGGGKGHYLQGGEQDRHLQRGGGGPDRQLADTFQNMGSRVGVEVGVEVGREVPDRLGPGLGLEDEEETTISETGRQGLEHNAGTAGKVPRKVGKSGDDLTTARGSEQMILVVTNVQTWARVRGEIGRPRKNAERL
mmetsp:Transcript_62393/g.131890  ORF Transcript_62393/g.131890 Transcript_62393/m.131890 type:complete len:239 (+) Transcript_62393:915-1631(+)